MSLSTVSRGLQIAKVAIQANRLRKSTTEEKKKIARRALASQFADARGSLMKVGQLLSSGQDDSFDELVKGGFNSDFYHFVGPEQGKGFPIKTRCLFNRKKGGK